MIKAAARALVLLCYLVVCSVAWAQDAGDMSQQDVLTRQLSERFTTGARSGIAVPKAKLPVTDATDRDEIRTSRAAAKPRSALPPEAPTEFQQQIEQSNGTKLPIFGQSLFDDVPDTFAPLDRVPVTAD